MRILLIVLFILSFFNTNAQELTIESVDLQTYNSFIEKDYKKSIQIGNKAIEQNIDFYFLRYRMGISFFEIKNFEKAVTHFEKAKAFDNSDFVLSEYLYFAYLYSGRKEKASLLAETFSEEFKIKVNYKPTFFKSIAGDFAYLNNKNNDNFNIKNDNYLNGIFYTDILASNLFITNQLSPVFKLQNNISFVVNTQNEITINNSLPIFEQKIIYTNKNNYLQWSSILSYFVNDWTISGGFGVYNSGYFTTNLVNQPPSNGNPPRRVPVSTETINTYFSGSLSIGKRFKFIEPTFSVSYSNISDFKTITSEASLTYFPFGNLNFYGNSKMGFVSNNINSNMIVTQLIGLKLHTKIWIETFAASGNHINYISDNGLQVFNTPNKINWYAGSNLNFYFQNFDFSIGYGIQERGSNYLSGNSSTTTNTIDYTFNYNSIKTKLIWKF